MTGSLNGASVSSTQPACPNQAARGRTLPLAGWFADCRGRLICWDGASVRQRERHTPWVGSIHVSPPSTTHLMATSPRLLSPGVVRRTSTLDRRMNDMLQLPELP